MILTIVGILTGEIKSGTDIVLTTETISQMTEDLMIKVTEAKVNTVEIEAAAMTEIAEVTMITEAVTTKEVTGVRGETAFPETGTLEMEEEIVILGSEILGAIEETVNPGVETLEIPGRTVSQEIWTPETTTADPETDSREIDLNPETDSREIDQNPEIDSREID